MRDIVANSVIYIITIYTFNIVEVQCRVYSGVSMRPWQTLADIICS